MDMYDVLVKEIDDKVKQLSEHIGLGRAETFEEYKQQKERANDRREHDGSEDAGSQER